MSAELTWPDVLTDLLAGHDLSSSAASWAMEQIMSGNAADAQMAAFLVALRAKGLTVEELTGISETMLALARRITVAGPTLDVVGTGGDRAHTVNISTMAALVAASTGLTVVKHGNRAASSSSGTADVLEALGVNLGLTPEQVVDVADRAGMTFCFAQVFHPSMRHAAGVRRELGIPTVFNVLGPLTNPAQPTYSAIGVADASMAPVVAGVFAARGRAAAIFRGGDGLDELTTSTTSDVWWAAEGRVVELTVDPVRLGLTPSPLSALRGGLPQHNARVVRETFDGRPGAVRDAVVLNAAIALAVASTAEGSSDSRVLDQARFEEAMRSAMAVAERSLDDGAAAGVLDRWAAVTREYAA